jgi:SAM-dependent methyltransferase
VKLSAEQQLEYEKNADQYWNDFYDQHQNRFFKDRHWLFTEFPELAPRPAPAAESTGVMTTPTVIESSSTGSESNIAQHEGEFPGYQAVTRLFEVGCGVGNTVIPVLQTNNDPGLFVYGCDLSSTAVQLLKEHSDYEPSRCHAFVCDIADPDSTIPFPIGSIDVIICIFVLSAIHPDKLPALCKRLAQLLKPGGLIVFRDYGRYDLTQLRFKTGRCLGENFYVRGDGTKVYFFTQEELRMLFVDGAGLIEQQNLIDRRLQVNRGRQIKMYRVWIQCKFRKPAAPQ